MKIRSRMLTKLAARGTVALLRLLFWTCRKELRFVDPRTSFAYVPPPDDPVRFVLCVWHDSLILPSFVGPPSLASCLVSRHQDGSYLAEALERLGCSTVRGSSSKGGAQAVRQMMSETQGKHLVITPDGPRGPRRQLKLGPIYLASQTGRALIPGAYSCRRGWRIKGSWTDLLIPKPFTTIYLLSGEPIAVPPDLSREQLQHYLEQAQRAMDRLNDEAERLATGRPEPPALRRVAA